MYTTRKTKERTRKFLDFLFRYVVEHDEQWSVPIEVACVCGTKHKIFPALWLAPVKDREWVNVRKDKGERPTAQWLAPLISVDAQLLESCKQEKPSKLLSLLGISISELLLYAFSKDAQGRLDLERAMGSLYSTYAADPSKLTRIAKLVEGNPAAFIQEIEHTLEVRVQIERNKAVGILVQTCCSSPCLARG